ncbi:MAG: glycosyltransferase involved in cell wall biosynthesis [Ulvibacter sp.]|jgi:glycosyltransferase involved in cell wall biosynthesis
MKIVYFYQYFTTPKGSYGTRVYEFTRRWVAQGHEVTVVSGVYYKSDIKAKGLVSDQFFDGVKVKVLNVEFNNKDSTFKRIFAFLKYSVLSTWYALTLPADVVIASSPPITIGIPGLVARYFRRRKLVVEVRDLWPDAPIELGIIKNEFIKKIAFAFEKICYRSASLVVTLSPGSAENIYSRLNYSRTISVPNSADNALFGKRNEDWQLPEWVNNRKYAIYTGNIGQTNNSGLLLNAARILKEKKITDIFILLIGDGQLKDGLLQSAKELDLNNFIILPLMPKTEVVNWVQNAMCSVIPLKDVPIIGTSSPNKLFDSLAAGIPIIQTTNGWIKTLLEDHQCGFTVSSEKPDQLADLLIDLSTKPDQIAKMGQKAKAIAQSEFDKIILADKMLEAIEKSIGKSKNDQEKKQEPEYQKSELEKL